MSLVHLIILLLVGAVCGFVAERLISSSMPFGWIGAIVAGLVGAWLMVDVLKIIIVPSLAIEGIPLISAIIGAIIVILVFNLVASRGKLSMRRR